MRGTFGDFSRSVSLLATLTVTGLLTIAAGANLRFAGGIANGMLFLDGSKNASSTSRVLVDGNAGTVTSTRFHTNGTALTDGYNIRITGLQGTYGTDGTNLALGTQTSDSIRFYTSNVSRWDINSSGDIVPSLTDGTLNIGAAASRVGTGFFTNVSSTDIRVLTSIVSESAGVANLGTSASNRFGSLYAGLSAGTCTLCITGGSGYELYALTGALDIRTVNGNIKMGTGSAGNSTEIYSNGQEALPHFRLTGGGDAVEFLAGNTTTKTLIHNASSTQIIGGIGYPTSTIIFGNTGAGTHGKRTCHQVYTPTGTLLYVTWTMAGPQMSVSPCNP